MEEKVQVLTPLFECLKKDNNDMILDIKDLMAGSNDLISDLQGDISTLKNEVDSLTSRLMILINMNMKMG